MASRVAHDPLLAMYRRGQIDLPTFRAARAFQRATNRAAIEAAIVRQTGTLGLALVRAVVAGATIADAARELGANSPRDVGSCGWWLRRSLRAVAIRIGERVV